VLRQVIELWKIRAKETDGKMVTRCQQFASSLLRVMVVHYFWDRWRKLGLWQMQTNGLAVDVLRNMRTDMRAIESNSNFRSSFELWRRICLVEMYFKDEPNRLATKIIRKWAKELLRRIAQRESRRQRLQVSRHKRVSAAILALWRNRILQTQKNLMLSDRLYFSCKRRANEGRKSFAFHAFVLCIVLRETEAGALVKKPRRGAFMNEDVQRHQELESGGSRGREAETKGGQRTTCNQRLRSVALLRDWSSHLDSVLVAGKQGADTHGGNNAPNTQTCRFTASKVSSDSAE